TLQASANVGGGAWSSFNITNLVKGWKSSSYNINCGFILQSSNESAAGNFFSSESAESNWPYLVLTYDYTPGTGGGSSFNTAKQIYLDESTALTTGYQNENRYYKFIAPVSGEYMFYSSNASGNPDIWLYNSSQTLMAYDDNTGGNNNFRLVANLTQGYTYYVAAGHSGTVTGGYTLNLLIAATIPTDVYHLRNEGTSQYVDIHGPVAQVLIHQWTYSAGAQSRWKITKQSDGYYTFQSEYGNKYYIGITNTSTGSDNIELFSSVSDSTRWKIYAKSSGEIFLEPKLAPGKVLYAPNHSVGTELRLTYLSSNLENRNKWKIEFQSNTTLEGQRWSNWCWATSARMLTNHYFDVPDERTQNVAVTAVKGAQINDGGTHGEAIRAAGVYRSNNVNSNVLNLVGGFGGVFSETTVRRFLNDGHVMYIARGLYVDGARWGGHATIIIGYTSVYLNGVLQCRYMIYDPWPANPPDPWDSPVITNGQFIIRSYQWKCNGRTGLIDDGGTDNRVWDRYVVVQTSYSSETIEPFWQS
ncbi:MAG: RICIN domain-containing protein, partial [Peptococcaceae bacterium]|nr:RICIN domain-containing protein [Peptococcaceae bacterium]